MPNDKPLTAEALKRLVSNADGQDIVGLQPGETFDPIGDMDRAIVEQELEEATAAAAAESPDSPVASPAPMTLPTDETPKPPTV